MLTVLILISIVIDIRTNSYVIKPMFQFSIKIKRKNEALHASSFYFPTFG